MIVSLTGVVAGRDDRSITLDVHGVGFRVFVHTGALQSIELQSNLTVVTHMRIREDAMELYGFLKLPELKLFEKLLTVSGVGPKMALGVLSAAGVEDLQQAIDQGRSSVLTKVSGVGKKTAERIIVDLRGKLEEEPDRGDHDLSAVIDALSSLGYNAREAREAAVATPAHLTVEERIRAALKRMA